MFLRLLVFTLLAILSLPVFAAKKLPLEVGAYEVTKGQADKCLPFSIKEIPLKEDEPIYVSPLYSFIAKNGKTSLKSDVDPDCSFNDQTKRKDKKNETTVSTVTNEVCLGKTRSTSTETFTLKPGIVILKVEVKGGEGYTCEWALSKAKK